MKGIAPRPIVLTVLAVSTIIGAFLRGNYLFGLGRGIVYACLATALVWLIVRSLTSTGHVSAVRTGLVVAFALPVAYAMAFPASVSPGMQSSIDAHARDRQLRAELAAVFASDPAFRDLRVSSVHLKVINVTVAGSLGTRADLDRLRARIASECPVLSSCVLHWDVSLRDTQERLSGLDRTVFQDVEANLTVAKTAAGERGH